ncbi:MAG: multiheme c-type cytochrome [Planctomycetota bacterium]|nr:multiheme c-type cytochrome [Planctomycetota bacterium]
MSLMMPRPQGLSLAGFFVCGLAVMGLSQEPTSQPPQSPVKSSPAAPPQPAEKAVSVVEQAVDQAHATCFENDPFPSAKKCAICHPQHFREWSVSPHSYAQLSPVFNAMSNKLIKLTNGTLGDFCIRCHTPVGMALDEPINMSNLDRHPTSREGVTCVVCHRINQAWGKGAGRLALVAGGVNQIVYGPIGSRVLNDVIAKPDEYGVLVGNLDSRVRAREVHANSQRFFHLTTSASCGACHDVFAPNGFRLEDAFSEFKVSPSARECGHNCQDCHMGAQPGQAKGFTFGPAAVVGGKKTESRKHTNHMMPGPDYSIIHRGLYPHHPTAIREESHGNNTGAAESDGLATMREWLMFDDAAGWGTVEFEKREHDNSQFSPPWDDPKMRRKARLILDEQNQLLAEYTGARLQVMQAGFGLGEITVDRADARELKFSIPVSNITTGHGVPTGFDAERVVFLRTMVWDGNGRLVFQSGDLDPNGDLRDNHSRFVHSGKIPLDRQLFSLQSRFVTRNVRGGEREQILNIPFSLDPLPYFRPATRPFTVLGRPVGARKHKQNLEVGGCRIARYRLSGPQLTCGPYTVRAQLIQGMVPVNLVHEISDVGFDYGLSAKCVADSIVDGHMVLREIVRRIDVK